jgi:hypothetical protein
MEKNQQAISWITNRLWHVARAHRANIAAIDWQKKDQEQVFVVEIQGEAGKRAAKSFDYTLLAQCPLSGEELALFDARLSPLVRFFRAK